MSKRNCRRSDEERLTHEKAVALRKMTDEQLVAAVEERYTEGHNDGHIAGYEKGHKNGLAEAKQLGRIMPITQIIERLSSIKGFGESTMAKIRAALLEG